MLRKVCLSLGFVVLIAAAGLAQTAQLCGLGSDPGGKIVVGAKIVMTDLATLGERSTVTNGSGLYAFTLMPASRYRMVVQASGFQTETQDGIVLTVAQSTELNIHLRVVKVEEQ